MTLIELMIVVSIVGVLAAIAIPAYSAYSIRSQISSALTLATPVKMRVAETYQSTGEWPAGNEAAGVALPSAITDAYVESVTVTGGGISIAFGNQSSAAISGTTLSLRPALNGNRDVVWQCGVAPLPEGVTLVESGTGALTTVPAKYLPAGCR